MSVPSGANNTLLLCRLCGIENIAQNELINIFDCTALNISSKIEYCLGINICESDYLPKYLCTECLDNLEKFNIFKIKSQKTSVLFQELFKTLNVSVDINDDPPEQKFNINDLPSVNNTENNESHSFEQVNTSVDLSNTKPTLKNQKTQINNTSNLVFQCGICTAKFSTHTIAIEHVLSVHNSKKAIVTIDNVKPVNVRAPYKKKPKIPKEFRCEHCPWVCNQRKSIYAHMRKHIYEKILPCTMCDLKFKYEDTLKKHIKIHLKEFDFFCDYCGEGFVDRKMLNNHVIRIHTKKFPYECVECNLKFASKSTFSNHKRAKHNDLRYKCEVCNKLFLSKYNLIEHEKCHLPEEERKKDYCKLCNAAFVSRSGLKSHMLIHTGELKHECNLCTNKYRSKTSLKLHMLTHTGEKNCVCEVCGKAFALPNNLKVHRVIHTGERPYECSDCFKTFTQKSSLNAHRKKSCSGAQNPK